MQKYHILINKGKEFSAEGMRLKGLVKSHSVYDITQQEELIHSLRANIRNERSKRWRHWVENAWDHKKNDIYRWIRGKKIYRPLIIIPGGSVQISDRLKEAEQAWGGL